MVSATFRIQLDEHATHNLDFGNNLGTLDLTVPTVVVLISRSHLLFQLIINTLPVQRVLLVENVLNFEGATGLNLLEIGICAL